MHGMVKYVFLIVGTLTLSLILYSWVFGAYSRQFYWNALEPAFQNSWGSATFHNGTDRTEVYDDMWNDISASEEIKW